MGGGDNASRLGHGARCRGVLHRFMQSPRLANASASGLIDQLPFGTHRGSGCLAVPATQSALCTRSPERPRGRLTRRFTREPKQPRRSHSRKTDACRTAVPGSGCGFVRMIAIRGTTVDAPIFSSGPSGSSGVRDARAAWCGVASRLRAGGSRCRSGDGRLDMPSVAPTRGPDESCGMARSNSGSGLRYSIPARCGHDAIGKARSAAASGRAGRWSRRTRGGWRRAPASGGVEFVDQENRRLDLGHVAWLAWPRPQDGGAIMGDEVLIGPVDARLVTARPGDPGPEFVVDSAFGTSSRKVSASAWAPSQSGNTSLNPAW
jgi:hypothetical protein